MNQLGKPRFRGAPPHCVAENRMAFLDREAAVAFMESLNVPVRRYWECVKCGGWHVQANLKKTVRRT